MVSILGASWVAQMVKNPPAMQETQVQSLGWEDPLDKGKATYSSGLENSMDCVVHRVAKSRTLQRTWVRSLVRELRSHTLCSEAKKKKRMTDSAHGNL